MGTEYKEITNTRSNDTVKRISIKQFVGGETFDGTFSDPGDYEFQCEPHAGAGMKGVIHVE